MKIVILTILITALAAPLAEAHEFTQTPEKAGYIVKGGTQTFTTSIGTITCTSETGTGSADGEKSEHLAVAAQYSGCTSSSKAATVSEGQYEYNANGTVTLTNTIEISFETSKGNRCVVTLAPTGNNEREAITYTDDSPGLTFKVALKVISYEGKGCCPHMEGEKEKATTGEIKGEAQTETYSGTNCVFTYLFAEYRDNECTLENILPFIGYFKEIDYTTLSYS
jgi:hypothetical protein